MTVRDIVVGLNKRGFLKFMPDELNIRLLYWAYMNKHLNLESPKSYNEKLQWIKLYDRNPLYTQLVDKYLVRSYVKDKIGDEFLIPLLGKWNYAEEIDFSNLPEQFVLKCNHDSGSIVICKDRKEFDYNNAVKNLSRHLKMGTYYAGREWPYKNVRPCIVAEQYMEDAETNELRDYKFFAFNGKVKAMFIATDRQSNNPTAFDFFDENFNHLDLRHGHPNASVVPAKPKNFDKMKNLAEILSENIPEVRVDFYEVNNKIYFGEMTFFHHGGTTPFDPPEWDDVFGSWIVLPTVKKED